MTEAIKKRENVKNRMESIEVSTNQSPCLAGAQGCVYLLKTNFSVGVNMYREKVTSYW